MNKVLLLGLLLASASMAGEKKLMHCFAFTPLKSATQADWDAFYKATDALPQKIKGVTRVWYGKLDRPFQADGQQRSFGVCMEMTDQATRRVYGSDPAHDAWTKIYSKVRDEPTTTFDIVGQ
jgi:stress responsive alpha/beta barrel protein